ncbi:hypothetical protein MVEN_01306700 [Mycena venus]|uniref:G-protein coupled receptors family 2 profile 2 domain-containing protein n=1 Tax=Mycena venus TaxID=2733690 RepID=A0A8H7CTV5_9AGAR|nr:hypothetical protein MVEN_01306700 [Mycena venus]
MSNTQLHIPNALDTHLQDVVLTFGTTGIVLTALLLCMIAYVAWNPVSRPHLNRVSFRLLVCALTSNLIFATISIPVFSGPSAGCSFMAFFGLSILMFSACMFFCTALNLQLVLVHHVNGNSMEKFYYLGSVATVATLNVAPLAAGQFGYYNGICWFNDPHPSVQFRWLLGSQVVWILLMSTGELVCFFVILGYMYHASHTQLKPVVGWLDIRVQCDSKAANCGVPQHHSSNRFAPNPYNILVFNSVLGLYPLLSCCLSFTGSILDIWLSKNPIPTELQWRLLFIDLCVYALRPILYTLLAATDPALIRAVRALRNHDKSTYSTDFTSGAKFTNSHSMKQFSINNSTLVDVQLEQEKNPTTWGPGGNKPHAEQSSAALEPFKVIVGSHGGAVGARGKPSFVEQQPEQSGLSQAQREREEEQELDVESQTCSRVEDIAQQI